MKSQNALKFLFVFEVFIYYFFLSMRYRKKTMEDEEYLPENSYLRLYLESLNLCDRESEDTVKENPCIYPAPSVEKTNANNTVKCIDKDVIDQIEELLAARLVFEEDVTNVERLLSNFKVVQVGMLRSIFENVSGFIVIVLGLCVYWVIGSYVLFMISIYYAYNAADYLWKKHYNQRRIKQLIEVLQDNFTSFKKTLKFIKDNDNILKLDVQSNVENSKYQSEKYELYFTLKEDFARAENEVISVLTRATKKLINKFPFYDYVENPNYYLCNRYEQHFLECVDLQKLYQIYLLVQSEFLQRLALSLIPNIKMAGNENSIELYKIIKETSVNLKRLDNKFSKKFKYIFIRGIYDMEKSFSLNVSRKSKLNIENQYKNELINNIQDLSNSFQKLLIRSRNIENNFPEGDKPGHVEEQLTDIQKELNLCQRSISDSFIILKKFLHKKNDIVNVTPEVSVGKIENTEPIDLSVKESSVDYEIFEAHFTGDEKNEKDDDYGFEDYMKKKLEREYSKLVLQELKSKIAEKAKFHEMREANAIVKRFNVNSELVDSDENGLPQGNDVEGYSLVPTDDDADENSSDSSEKITYPPPQVPNSDFMADIIKAREKLIKTPAAEEYFCDSGGEESE